MSSSQEATAQMTKLHRQTSAYRALGLLGCLLIAGAAFWLGHVWTGPIDHMPDRGQWIAIVLMIVGADMALIGFSQLGRTHAAYREERKRLDVLVRQVTAAPAQPTDGQKSGGTRQGS